MSHDAAGHTNNTLYISSSIILAITVNIFPEDFCLTYEAKRMSAHHRHQHTHHTTSTNVTKNKAVAADVLVQCNHFVRVNSVKEVVQ